MQTRTVFGVGCLLLLLASSVASQVVLPPTDNSIIVGAYNTSPPTLTNGQAGMVQVDSAGNLKVNVAAGGASGGTASTFGAAFPGTGTAVGFTDGTNMIAGTVDASGYLKVNCSAGCAGGSFNNNADNVATSATNGQSAAWNYVWDGAAWDRLYGDSTNGLFANIKTSVLPTGAATAANQATEIASLATIATNTGAAIPAGTAIIGKVGIDQTTPGTTNLVAAGQTGTWTVQPGNTANTTAWLVNQANPYPSTAVPYTATATGTTGATTATLAGAASVTTYLCGFSIRANATAAVTGNATVTGVITATLNFTQWTAPNASGLGVTEMIFAPCIPASGTNQSVAVVSAAPGTGGVVSVTAWGYKL